MCYTNLEGYYSLSGGTRIPSGADMLADTYKVPGNYACIDNTIASTLKNCPISRAFILKVDLSTGNAYPRQTFLQFNNGKVFTRVFDAFENKWAETFSNLTNADLKVTLRNNAKLEIYSDVDTSYIDSFSGNTRRHRLVWSDGGLTLYKYSGNINTKIWSSY